jgi:hypothetical protein
MNDVINGTEEMFARIHEESKKSLEKGKASRCKRPEPGPEVLCTAWGKRSHCAKAQDAGSDIGESKFPECALRQLAFGFHTFPELMSDAACSELKF